MNMLFMQLTQMFSRFRTDMINALRLTSTKKIKREKEKVTTLSTNSFDFEILEEINQIELTKNSNSFNQEWKHYNFYTKVVVVMSSTERKIFSVSNVLVNDEVTVNLMSKRMIRQMNLTLKSSVVSVRIDNESYERLHDTCFLKLIVQKVTKHVSFSIISENFSYEMLLERSWLRSIEVIEDYLNNTYYIRDNEGKRCRVKTTMFSNYKSFSHVRLNDNARNLNQAKREDILLFDEKTLTKLKMTKDRFIDEVLKEIFEQVMNEEEQELNNDTNSKTESLKD